MAGPLVAACVVLPRYCYLPGVRDSKSLSPSQREKLYREICSSSLAIGIGMVGERFIDAAGIEKANGFVFQEAIYRASSSRFPEFLILDWVKVPFFRLLLCLYLKQKAKVWLWQQLLWWLKCSGMKLWKTFISLFFPITVFLNTKDMVPLSIEEKLRNGVLKIAIA